MNIFQKTAVFLLSKAIGPKMQYSFSSGQWVFPDDNKNVYISSGYKELPNLYAIISLIIQKSSIVPFEVYKVTNRAKYRVYSAKMKNAKTSRDIADCRLMMAKSLDKVENSEIEQLLNKPNSSQTIEQLFEQLDGYKLLTGNSYLWAWTPGVGNNASKPTQLHVPPSTMVSVITGDFENPIKEYKLTYLAEPIDAQDMAHFKEWNPLTSGSDINESVYGMSPLTSCRRLMQKYKDADVAQGSMFKNMSPAGILAGEKDAEVTEPQANQIKDRFKQLHSGVDKAGEIIVTSANLRWTQIGFSPVDLNIIQGKEEMLGELCNVYHVPIGLFSKNNSTENNMVESRKILITDAVIPLVEARKSILNNWLAPKFGEEYVLEFDYTIFSEISEEVKSLAETALKMWWISGNEKRQMTGYDKSENVNMEKIYVPSGLTEIDSLNRDPLELDEDPLL
jgi:HK97 family phage portal protein